MTFYALNRWDPGYGDLNERIEIFSTDDNGNSIEIFKSDSFSTYDGNLCPKNVGENVQIPLDSSNFNYDKKLYVDFTYDHTVDFIEINIIPTMAYVENYNEYWGFRDFQLNFYSTEASSEAECPHIRDPFVEPVAAVNANPGECDVVTFYTECDFQGDAYVFDPEDDCLPFQP